MRKLSPPDSSYTLPAEVKLPCCNILLYPRGCRLALDSSHTDCLCVACRQSDSSPPCSADSSPAGTAGASPGAQQQHCRPEFERASGDERSQSKPCSISAFACGYGMLCSHCWTSGCLNPQGSSQTPFCGSPFYACAHWRVAEACPQDCLPPLQRERGDGAQQVLIS